MNVDPRTWSLLRDHWLQIAVIARHARQHGRCFVVELGGVA